jgi:hypothetical protein
VKTFQCDWPGCNYASPHKGTLNRHKRQHTGEKRYKCDVEGCNLRFAQGGTLARHKRQHTCEKRYKCNWKGCNLRFAQSSTLVTHKRTHTCEKPYKCDWEGCNLRFAQRGALARHKRQHTGNKPYKCNWEGCNLSFAQRGTLVDHKNNVHIAPRCVICDIFRASRDNGTRGWCDDGYLYGAKERAVLAALNGLAFAPHLVRDQALGCGTRRRPDAYLVLSHTDDDGVTHFVLFIIEVDERQHGSNTVQCELARLQEIQNRHGGPVFVIRYNPDQKDGLGEAKLKAFAQRCQRIVESDYAKVLDVHGALLVEYHGYTDDRVRQLDTAQLSHHVQAEMNHM